MRTNVVRCLDSLKPLVSISEISSLYLASVAAQASLSLTRSQTPKTGFLMTRLIYDCGSSPQFLFFPKLYMSRLMTKPAKWHVRPAKTQVSLGIRPVSSESSLFAWRKLGSLATHSEDSDQTGRMPRLIWVFAGRICHFVCFVMRRLIWNIALTQCVQCKWTVCTRQRTVRRGLLGGP